ncbi:MAG: DUF1292 domain-containing protein [Oscillibacter sp.]|nr:DUF1292 domain-containing protein [Oscillibacter sp.]MBQ2996828.1 DUF1292 domain-containing protein [Oscillibacter sp.]
MHEDNEPIFITLTDEDGQEFELEFLSDLEYQGTAYKIFQTTESEDEEADEDEGGLVIMKVIVENGEEILSLPDSEEEAEAVYELFMEELFAEEEEE